MPNHKLKALRTEKKLNQTQMAELLGIGVVAYNLKENGQREFKIEEIKKLVEIFGVTFEDIFLHSNYSK